MKVNYYTRRDEFVFAGASYEDFVIRVKFLQTACENEEIIIICKTYGFSVCRKLIDLF
jgi:hypothetical protein